MRLLGFYCRIRMPERRNILIEQILRHSYILIGLLAAYIHNFPFRLINRLPFIIHQLNLGNASLVVFRIRG